jgi:hypothetical protein
MKRILILFYSVLIPLVLLPQSKSVERFRKSYKEDQNLFFYSSTIKMLNTENEPEFEDLIKDVEKIMVLFYDKEKQQLKDHQIDGLKNELLNEKYVPLIFINEKGSEINLYKRDRKNKTVGFAALIDNTKKLVIIDVKGSIDFRKFMDFKNKIDLRL